MSEVRLMMTGMMCIYPCDYIIYIVKSINSENWMTSVNTCSASSKNRTEQKIYITTKIFIGIKTLVLKQNVFLSTA